MQSYVERVISMKHDLLHINEVKDTLIAYKYNTTQILTYMEYPRLR